LPPLGDGGATAAESLGTGAQTQEPDVSDVYEIDSPFPTEPTAPESTALPIEETPIIEPIVDNQPGVAQAKQPNQSSEPITQQPVVTPGQPELSQPIDTTVIPPEGIILPTDVTNVEQPIKD
jgi:hypothetical protein